MPSRRTIRLLAGLLIAAPSVGVAQSRVLVARLGTDTLSIEKFTRTGNTITGKYLMHSPTTLLIGFTLVMRPDGTVASMEQTIADGRGQPVAGQPTAARMRFTGDTVFRSMTVNGQAVESKLAVPSGTFPALGRPWLLMELGIHAAHHAGTSIYYTINAAPQATQPNTWPLRFVRPDSIEVTYSPAPLVVRLDAKGEILRIDGIRSTLKAVVTPAADADIDAIGARWAAADAAGQAMGAPSSRDTARARVGAASLLVDYGRPLRRGRVIWGTVVPYDSVWRLGANAATQFTTDRDIELGGRPLAAGSYSLWMVPSATGGTLIVNRQTKQWGTQYDAAQDLIRVPVTRSASGAPVERFTVSIESDAIRFTWDDAVYSVMLRAP